MQQHYTSRYLSFIAESQADNSKELEMMMEKFSTLQASPFTIW